MMDTPMWGSILTEWLSLIFRWLHVVAAIGWIGSSFYFIHLDLSLRPDRGLPDGVQGEAWQVHGGGFYRIMKYLVAPSQMPEELTWFKWEAYTTWLSGFALMVIVYYLDAELFLVDKSVLDLTPWQAGLFSVTGVSIHVGSSQPARAKRVGIQYWRMASMAAGISLWALRNNSAVSRPFLAGPSSGRP